jgi:hypothetical protein
MGPLEKLCLSIESCNMQNLFNNNYCCNGKLSTCGSLGGREGKHVDNFPKINFLIFKAINYNLLN